MSPTKLTLEDVGFQRVKEPPRGKGIVRSLFAEVLLLVGAVTLAFGFYQAYWTNFASAQKQDKADQALEKQWKNPRSLHTPELGEAFARMYIPSFGSDYQFAIIEGVSDADLTVGPGHYPDTQMPGEKGNFAVAGHRVGTGAPFNDLDKLETCDSIVVETQDRWDIYRVMPMDAGQGADCFSDVQNDDMRAGEYSAVVGRHITVPSDVSVIDKIPGSRGAIAEEALQNIMTLTTCHPRFSDAERMIIHSMQTASYPKSEFPQPPELTSEVD